MRRNLSKITMNETMPQWLFEQQYFQLILHDKHNLIGRTTEIEIVYFKYYTYNHIKDKEIGPVIAPEDLSAEQEVSSQPIYIAEAYNNLLGNHMLELDIML